MLVLFSGAVFFFGGGVGIPRFPSQEQKKYILRQNKQVPGPKNRREKDLTRLGSSRPFLKRTYFGEETFLQNTYQAAGIFNYDKVSTVARQESCKNWR